MDSIIELQKIDCNCNDCIFMERDVDKFKESLERHKKIQENYFNLHRGKLLKRAREWRIKGDLLKYNTVANEADKMKFQFDKKIVLINYGRCSKKNVDVTFIPNTCQPDTQECFSHRRG